MDIAARPRVENIPTKGRAPLDWREVWRYRELVAFLALERR
jgi:hypothetical protein